MATPEPTPAPRRQSAGRHNQPRTQHQIERYQRWLAQSRGLQFDSYDAFANGGYNFGAYSVDSLEMPQAQRTWSLFWGDRGNNLLKVTRNTDAPTIIMDAGGILAPRPQP